MIGRQFLVVACLATLACAAVPPAPSPSDWTTVYSGTGPIAVHVTNAAASPLFLKVRDPARRTAAQVQLRAQGNETLHVASGAYHTVMRLSDGAVVHFLRGPDFALPAGIAEASMTLTPSTTSNLTPIDAAEFDR